MKEIKSYVQGEWVSANKGRKVPVYLPATGESYGSLLCCTQEEVDYAVHGAKLAFIGWSQSSCEERSYHLREIAELVRQNQDELARIESEDQGKPLWLASNVDIPRTIANFEFFAGAILHQESECYFDHKGDMHYTHRSPLGVVGLIAPWNLPLYLLSWKMAPALAMGNAILAKPSELTSRSAEFLFHLIDQSSLPKGICNLLLGDGQTGELICTHPEVRGLSFTGSTKTGHAILKKTSDQLKKVSLELGGKNPNVIFEDAALEKCIETSLRSSFLNQGEICLCGSRILVHQSIEEAFTQRFLEKASRLPTGNPSSENNFLGALISKEHREKVSSYIEQAKDWDGTILLDGREVLRKLESPYDKGYYIGPSIVTGLKGGFDCPLIRDEIFGPVVTIESFADEKEALKKANHPSYGLSASIWTRDLARAQRFSQKIKAGMVWVNTWMQRDLRTPFGGVDASGIGREGGKDSLKFFSEEKSICLTQ